MASAFASSSAPCLHPNKPQTGRKPRAGLSTSVQHISSVAALQHAGCSFRPNRNWGSVKVQARTTSEPATTAPPTAQDMERSALVNQELVLFLYQLDFDTQLQRALNYEKYDLAQEIRSQRSLVDQAIRELQESKGDGCGVRSSKSAFEFTDTAAAGLRLRSELQLAIEEERYADAAAIRDALNEMKNTSEAEALRAAQARIDERGFRLGQRVVHSLHGYRGVVCGWDVSCCEDAEWQTKAGVSNLTRGADQTFYFVLVDQRDWPGSVQQPPVAYVAEELLMAPEEPKTWRMEYGEDKLQHPYSYLMFLGTDAAGDLIPCRQLREKYSAPRRDVGSSHEDEENPSA